MTPQTIDITKEQAELAANQRAWKKLDPSNPKNKYGRKVEVWVGRDALNMLEELRAAGQIDNEFDPRISLGTLIYAALERDVAALRRRQRDAQEQAVAA